MKANETRIARHKTAIRRPSYSLPIKCLLRDGLVHGETTVFVRKLDLHLRELGLTLRGHRLLSNGTAMSFEEPTP